MLNLILTPTIRKLFLKLFRNLEELISTAQQSFSEIDASTVEDVFLPLEACLLEVLKRRGDKKYKVTHIGKEKLRKQGLLTDNLDCPEDLLQEI